MRTPMLIGFAAAVVLGLTAGVGAALVLAPPAAPGDASDTSAVAAAAAAGAKQAAGDSAHAPTDTAGAAAPHTAAHPVGGPRPVARPLDLPVTHTRPSTPVRPALDTAALRRAAAHKAARERLGKMFGTMEPKGAAAVLERMSDADIMQILGAIPERQAAAILEYFTPQRAAAVSRALLHSARSTP